MPETFCSYRSDAGKTTTLCPAFKTLEGETSCALKTIVVDGKKQAPDSPAAISQAQSARDWLKETLDQPPCLNIEAVLNN